MIVVFPPIQYSDYLTSTSLKLQHLEAHAFSIFSPEKVRACLRDKLLVLLGTSCSGKTSLSNAIAKSNPRAIIIEHDVRLRQLALEFFKNKAQESFDQLYSIFGPSMLHYISCPEDDPFWMRNQDQLSLHILHVVKLRHLCEKHFKELHEAAYRSIKEDCKFFACLGFTVIVHVVGNRGLSHFTPFTSKIMLFYCSFTSLCSRIKQRNQQAFVENKPLEMRYASVVFEQFSKLYRVQHEKDVGISVGKVNAKKMSETIKQYHQMTTFFSPRIINVKEYVRDIFQNLKNKGKSEFFLTPCSNFSILINTTKVASPSLYMASNVSSKLLK